MVDKHDRDIFSNNAHMIYIGWSVLLPNHGEKAMNIPRKLTLFQKIP